MAQRTNQVAAFANGAVRAEVDWNDANGSMTRFRVFNDSDQPAYLYALLNPPVNGYSEVSLTAPPHQTTQNNLPSNTVKYTKEIEDGVEGWKLYGVRIFCRFPA